MLVALLPTQLVKMSTKRKGKEGQARVDLLHKKSVERVWVSALCWWSCCTLKTARHGSDAMEI